MDSSDDTVVAKGDNFDLFQCFDGSIRLETCYEDVLIPASKVEQLSLKLLRKTPAFQRLLELTQVEAHLDLSPLDPEEEKLLEIRKVLTND